MSNFVKLHWAGEVLLVNMELVREIEAHKLFPKGSILWYFHDDCNLVDESLEELEKLCTHL